MTTFYLLIAFVVLVSLGAGMFRILAGPTPADRMLVIQLFGTAAVAALILIGKARNDPAFVDIALVLAVLAAISMVAFVKRAWSVERIDEPRD